MHKMIQNAQNAPGTYAQSQPIPTRESVVNTKRFAPLRSLRPCDSEVAIAKSALRLSQAMSLLSQHAFTLHIYNVDNIIYIYTFHI